MAVEDQPSRGVSVDLSTLGATAREADLLRGLTDWGGNTGFDMRFANDAGFTPAENLTRSHDKMLRVAWGATKLIDNLHNRYADALYAAVEEYGATDRHSGRAVDVAARGMAGDAGDD